MVVTDTVMNRTTALEALRHAARGDKVVIVGETLPRAQAVMDYMLEIYPEDLRKPGVRRRHGDQCLAFPGAGTIWFKSFRSNCRGWSIDRLYVPLGTHPDTAEDMLPCLSVSGGPIIGYMP